jgi:hypothetical protein
MMVGQNDREIAIRGRFSLFCPLVVLSLLAFGGCGPSGPTTYPVSGTVTFNGEPIPTGYITFTPDDPTLAPESGPITDGKFSFRAREGGKTVKIEADRYVEGAQNPVMGMNPKYQYIPKKYNENSTLKEEVKPDDESNKYTFTLTDKE